MDKPTVILKRNKIQDLFDYCLDNKIAFTTKERELGIDEFEITLEIQDVKKAILLGMFLRENRLELAGMGSSDAKTAVKKAAVAKKAVEPVHNPLISVQPIPAKETEEPVISEKTENSALSFDLN